MRHSIPLTVAIAVLSMVVCQPAEATGITSDSAAPDLTGRALAGDAAAIAALRAQGPSGLQTLLEACAGEIANGPPRVKGRGAEPSPQAVAAWQRLRTVIDAVAAQRDDWATRLFWYTDLEQAKAAAQREHKPILSLRLLGRLDQELSCANSRFFRTTLYPDPAVNKLLRERFILHWSSERPVPVVTIDFGDGRIVKRTLTGNSIHYVLDAQGRPIDGIPGLYSAGEFVHQLRADLDLFDRLSRTDTAAWSQVLADQHLAALKALEVDWNRRIAQLDQAGAAPPILQAALHPAANPATEAKALPLTEIGDPLWQALADADPGRVSFPPQVMAVVKTKFPPARRAERITFSKAAVESPLVLAISRLQDTITQDTLRNEFQLHRQIHAWFIQSPTQVTRSFDSLNKAVYDDLFLTPRSDPWLGLARPDIYSALENGGLSTK